MDFFGEEIFSVLFVKSTDFSAAWYVGDLSTIALPISVLTTKRVTHSLLVFYSLRVGYENSSLVKRLSIASSIAVPRRSVFTMHKQISAADD